MDLPGEHMASDLASGRDRSVRSAASCCRWRMLPVTASRSWLPPLLSDEGAAADDGDDQPAFPEQLDRLARGPSRDPELLHQLVLRRDRPIREKVTRRDTRLDSVRYLHVQRRRAFMVDHIPTISPSRVS